jgi:hypothetical protein
MLALGFGLKPVAGEIGPQTLKVWGAISNPAPPLRTTHTPDIPSLIFHVAHIRNVPDTVWRRLTNWFLVK